jgi:hypothetical protein
MNWLKNFWKKLKGLFKKRPPTTEKIISELESIVKKEIDVEKTYIKILESSDDREKDRLLEIIAEQEVAKKILKINEYQSFAKKRGWKNFYELHELRAELQKLEEQKAKLHLVELNIQPVINPNTSSFDSRIDKLFSLLSKNKKDDKVRLSNFYILAFDKDFKQLEKLISDKSTLRRHYNRESEKRKQREIYERDIKKELDYIDSLIEQDKLKEAKSLLLTKSINPDYKKGVERLSKATAKLKEKELKVIRLRQEELLRQQQEEAERIRIEQDRILEQQRIAREQIETRRKNEDAEKLEKESKLKALLTKKINWRDFQRVLQKNEITAFYHFTDYHNLKSIKENNGLYSWHYADSNGIIINYPGGDTQSRGLDKSYGLQDYVRVSFCTDHPMQFRLKQSGRNLVLLVVDIEVAYYENTIFCDMNATDKNHKKGTEIKDLERIKFLATKRNYVRKEDSDFKYHQAEVLIKTWIPLQHIKNISNFI